VRIGALTRQNGESQMTKMKTLSAVIILSAAVASPVFAQDVGVRGPGSRYGLDHHTRMKSHAVASEQLRNSNAYAAPGDIAVQSDWSNYANGAMASGVAGH
jgi:hypothetical protein